MLLCPSTSLGHAHPDGIERCENPEPAEESRLQRESIFTRSSLAEKILLTFARPRSGQNFRKDGFCLFSSYSRRDESDECVAIEVERVYTTYKELQPTVLANNPQGRVPTIIGLRLAVAVPSNSVPRKPTSNLHHHAAFPFIHGTVARRFSRTVTPILAYGSYDVGQNSCGSKSGSRLIGL